MKHLNYALKIIEFWTKLVNEFWIFKNSPLLRKSIDETWLNYAKLLRQTKPRTWSGKRGDPRPTCLRRAVSIYSFADILFAYEFSLMSMSPRRFPFTLSSNRLAGGRCGVPLRGCCLRRQETYLNKVLIGKCHPLANIWASYLSRHAKNRRIRFQRSV